MRGQSITASLRRSPVVAIAPKNVPGRLLRSATFSRGMAEGPRRRRRKLGTLTSCLEPFEHDLAARFSGFQERVRTLEICRIDGAEVLRNRGADFPRVDESCDLV